MSKETTDFHAESRACWENLESWVRQKVQGFVQELLEQEVTELLGRSRHQRRAAVDSRPGYRNGHGKRRKLTMSCGTVTVRRPRVRGLEQRFESRILPLCVKRSRQVAELIPELYLHGLAEGDFDLALRGLLGEEAPLSASTVARLKKGWQGEWQVWKSRRLEDLEPVYVWVDGVYVKAGFEKEKAAVLVVLAALSDGTKRVLAIAPGYRESEGSWSEVLRDLKARGLKCPRLVVGDGHLGIWAALSRGTWRPNLCSVRSPTRRASSRLSGGASFSSAGAGSKATRLRSSVSIGTGIGWSPSTAFRRSSGSTYERRIRWNRPLRRCGCGPLQPSASKRSTTRQL
jgi:transposase-like protein